MKTIYVILGSLSLTLGILGIFLPLLPTTPFILITAALYMRGSPRLYGWLVSNRYLGTYLRNYREKQAVTLTAKVVSLALLWGTMLFCIFGVIDTVWVRILLGAILVGVTVHILSFRTMRLSEVVKMRKVRTPKDIETVAGLAGEIWSEYYVPLISRSQIEYMLEKFQSVPAITGQINDGGFEYYLIEVGRTVAGYMGLHQNGDMLMLSKIYVLKAYRGRGIAGEALSFVESICLRRGLRKIWLTVNKGNTASIEIYKKKGFCVTEEVVTDIGDGFSMDDYIMEKEVKI